MENNNSAPSVLEWGKNLRHVNIRRGLFRLWVLFTIVWCLAVAGVGATGIIEVLNEGNPVGISIDAFLDGGGFTIVTENNDEAPVTRTVPQTTSDKIAKSTFSEQEKQIIIYGLENGKSLDDTKEAVFRYRTTGSPVDPNKQEQRDYIKEAWTILGYTLLAFFAGPLSVFALGYSLGYALLWVFAGFRSTRV